MRLAGQTKMGYYPTPEKQTELICSCLKGEGDTTFMRLLDPCCGNGTALATIGKHLDTVKTYGVELSDVRSEEAKKVLRKVLLSPFEHTVMTNGTFSLILLNPPYDGEEVTGGGTRLEELFLKLNISLLAENGILVYIIPQPRVTPNVAKMLAGWFEELHCFKFAGDDFEDFNQVIIFGKKKQYRNPTELAINEITHWAMGEIVTGWSEDKEPVPTIIRMLDISPGTVTLPVVAAPERGEGRQVFRFKFQPISGEDYMRMGTEAMQRLSATKAWLDFCPPLEKAPIEPAISPNQGHIGMQVTGNLLGTVKLMHDSKPMLLKGSLLKVSSKIEEDDLNQIDGSDTKPGDEKHKNMKKVEVKERFEPIITTMTQDGLGEMVVDPNDVTELLKKHINELVQIVEDRNVPLYRYDPTEDEWNRVSKLSKGRSWPGQPAGFSEQQKHIIVAGTRALAKHGVIFQIVEMGGGKTGVGAAMVEMRDAYPAFVVAPGMVTSESANWNEEVSQVIEGAKIKTAYITAHPVPKPLKIIDWVRSRTTDDLDIPVKELDGADAKTVFNAIQQAARNVKRFMSAETSRALRASLQIAERNPPAKMRGSDLPNLLNARIGGLLWLDAVMEYDQKSADEIASKYSMVQFIDDYKRGILPKKSFAMMSYETAKLGAGREPAYARKVFHYEEYDRYVGEYKTRYKVVPCCPKCGAPIADEYRVYDDKHFGEPLLDKLIELDKIEAWCARTTRFCQAPKPRRIWRPDEKWQDDKMEEHVGRHVDVRYDGNNLPYTCGAPLFQNTTFHRYPGASYVKAQAKGFFKTVILDELHKAKSEDTGVGQVMATLAGITDNVIGLTGTLFGGYSSSIFPILYRVLPQVKRAYDHGDHIKWASDMGLIKHSFYVRKGAQVGETGAYTGRKQHERVDELPGISPNIAKYILPICIFQSLPEMGLPLPDYNEEVVRIPMTQEMRDQYDEMDGSKTNSGLFKWAVDEKKRPDGTGKGAIGVWWNAIFGRPNSMFRTDIITFNRRIGGFGSGRWAERNLEIVREEPPVYSDNRLLPKEEWLFNTVKAQHAIGRKVIVYIRQTSTKDIQEHISEVLSKTGLRVSILSPSIATNKRIDWLKKNAPKFDVLITNPRLIEVGLNLTMLPTAVFFEIDASFYTLYQAMKRIYRPFAPKPVQIYFAVYEDTAEDTIFNVMGEKFLSNQLLTGQEISGVLVPEDAGNVLQVAIYRTMNKIEVKKAMGLFGVQNKGTTTSPVGSITAASPVLTAGSMEEWLIKHGFATGKVPIRGKKRKLGIVPSGQLAFALFAMTTPVEGEEADK